MRATLLGLALVIGCGPKASSKPEPASTLCIDPAAMPGTPLPLELPEGASIQADDPVFDAIAGDRMKMASVSQGGLRAAVLARSCDPAPCEPKVVFVGDDGQIRASVMLPHAAEIWQGGDYPFVVTALVVEGDHLWIAYQVIGEPEPAVGSTMRDYLAIVRASDAAVLLELELGTSPEADSLEACAVTLHAVDADCDGDADLLAHRQCQLALCTRLFDDVPSPPECDGSTMTSSHAVYRRGADGAYAAYSE